MIVAPPDGGSSVASTAPHPYRRNGRTYIDLRIVVDHPRMSRQTLRLLSVMLADIDVEWFGLSLSKATSIAPGTLYPILHRLHRAEWLEARTEDINPSDLKRPARRLYRLTGKGELAAQARVRSNESASPPSRLRPRGQSL
jgi:PadR family transcriptional regulator PadR